MLDLKEQSILNRLGKTFEILIKKWCTPSVYSLWFTGKNVRKFTGAGPEKRQNNNTEESVL